MGGAVEEGPAGLLPAAQDAYQISGQQLLEGASGVHAADRVDLGPGHRLAIGYYGHHLQGRSAHAYGLDLFESAHPPGVLRVGSKLESSIHLHHRNSGIGAQLHQRPQDPPNPRRAPFTKQLLELGRLQGFLRSKKQALHNGNQPRRHIVIHHQPGLFPLFP